MKIQPGTEIFSSSVDHMCVCVHVFIYIYILIDTYIDIDTDKYICVCGMSDTFLFKGAYRHHSLPYMYIYIYIDTHTHTHALWVQICKHQTTCKSGIEVLWQKWFCRELARQRIWIGLGFPKTTSPSSPPLVGWEAQNGTQSDFRGIQMGNVHSHVEVLHFDSASCWPCSQRSYMAYLMPKGTLAWVSGQDAPH